MRDSKFAVILQHRLPCLLLNNKKFLFLAFRCSEKIGMILPAILEKKEVTELSAILASSCLIFDS